MTRIKIVHCILIISFPTIYSQLWGWPFTSQPNETTTFQLNYDSIPPFEKNKYCPIYNRQEQLVTLTYNEFRDSSNKVVRIYDDIEQPLSISSFFITRNKRLINQHRECVNGKHYYSDNCEQWNNECEQKIRFKNCIQIEGTPVLLYLDISNGTLQNLHPNTFVTVSECLQYLVLKENEIDKISQKAFFSLTNLRYLDLSQNKLTGWDSLLLENLNLKYLNLSYNLIGKLDENALASIEFVDISHNSLLQFNLNHTQNNSIPLNSLNIANNQLESIYLSNAIYLRMLDISHNKIKSLKNCILNSNLLFQIYASYNKINDFDISNLIGLEYLNFSNNNIEFINSTTLTTSLIELDLSNNTIILQSNMFEYSSNLIRLLLNNNAINDVPVNTFYGLINLKTLSLANNNLKSFEFGSFSGLINLETLDLSNNQINYFDSNKFMNLNNLQILLIDGNPFNNLNLTDLNVKLINLRTIGLTNMFWTCEKLVKVIIELRKMNVSLKNNSLSNQLNYNIDGINCIPDGYETANYLKKIFIQSTTIQPVVNNKSLKIENVQSVRNSTDLTNTKHLEHNKSVILPDIDNSLNQFQNSIEYNNVSMPPLFLIFLQKIENIIKNETGYIKNSLKNLESTTSLLLHKFEEIEELHHLKHDVKADTLIEGPTFTTEYYDSDFSLMYNDEN